MYYILLYYIILYHIIFYYILYFIILYIYIYILYYILFYIILFYNIVFYILYYIIFFVIYYILLYYIYVCVSCMCVCVAVPVSQRRGWFFFLGGCLIQIGGSHRCWWLRFLGIRLVGLTSLKVSASSIVHFLPVDCISYSCQTIINNPRNHHQLVDIGGINHSQMAGLLLCYPN